MAHVVLVFDDECRLIVDFVPRTRVLKFGSVRELCVELFRFWFSAELTEQHAGDQQWTRAGALSQCSAPKPTS
jgi:hypothetical protein